MPARVKHDVDVSVVGLTVALAVRQAGLPSQPAVPVSIERIQRELKKLPPLEPQQERLRIRVTIEAHPLRLSVPWDPANDTAVPSYVRPAMPLYHYEFLRAVTPEAFRGATLFPISINLLPGVERGVQAIRDVIRGYEEARVRKEVQEELRRFLQAREKDKEKNKQEERPKQALQPLVSSSTPPSRAIARFARAS